MRASERLAQELKMPVGQCCFAPYYVSCGGSWPQGNVLRNDMRPDLIRCSLKFRLDRRRPYKVCCPPFLLSSGPSARLPAPTTPLRGATPRFIIPRRQASGSRVCSHLTLNSHDHPATYSGE